MTTGKDEHITDALTWAVKYWNTHQNSSGDEVFKAVGNLLRYIAYLEKPTPAQPAPTVAPAGGEVEYVSPHSADDFYKLMGLRISEGDNITFVPAEQRKLRELLKPATPQGQGDVLDTLLTDAERHKAWTDTYPRGDYYAALIKAQDAKTRRLLAAQPHVQSPTVEQLKGIQYVWVSKTDNGLGGYAICNACGEKRETACKPDCWLGNAIKAGGAV